MDSDLLPDDVLEQGSLSIMQLLEVLVMRSALVQCALRFTRVQNRQNVENQSDWKSHRF